MYKTFHLCRSSHSEVMFRSESDMIIGFNYLAYSALETDAKLVAEAIISTHSHQIARCYNPEELNKRFRYAYTRYFNAKYHRKGSLGEKKCFKLELNGLYHTQTATSYVLRQALHHGLTSTPFEYPHCSINAFFRKELGKTDRPALLPDDRRHQFLPRNIKMPADYRMAENGLLLREDVLDTSYVESLYVSPRNFLYQMNRVSNDKIINEQLSEPFSAPITLDVIEKGVPDFDPAKVFIDEAGRVNHNKVTDIELCHIIDDVFLPGQYFKGGQEFSIYLLPETKRKEIGNRIWQESRTLKSGNGLLSGRIITEAQLKRCLVI